MDDFTKVHGFMISPDSEAATPAKEELISRTARLSVSSKVDRAIFNFLRCNIHVNLFVIKWS